MIELLTKFCAEGELDKALEIVFLICHKGMEVSIDNLYCLIQSCVNYKSIYTGREVRDLIARCGFEQNNFLASHLIRMFTFFGSLVEANLVFNKLSNPSVFAWSATISAHVSLGQADKAIQLYHKMKRSNVIPNEYVFVSGLKACAHTASLVDGKLIHAHVIESQTEFKVIVGNTLVDMYAKSGALQDAVHVFWRLPIRDIVTWNAMIAGFFHNGHLQDALQLFGQLQQEGVQPNLVTFNVIIAGYAEHGHGHDALRLYQQMQHEGFEPSKATYISSIQASSKIVALKQGKMIHVQVNGTNLKSDLHVGSALIDMYVECGSLEGARTVFDNLPTRDLVIWNAMIAGYAQQGHGHMALCFFNEMQDEGMQPDKFTFVGIVKSCSQVGALVQGKQIHAYIIESGFDFDVYIGSTLIDMYCKWHNLEDGHRVFDTLPKCNIVTWNTMIAGHAQHGDYKSALRYFNLMQCEGLKPDDVTFVCLLSASSHVGMVDEAYNHLQVMIQDYGLSPSLDHFDCVVDILGRAGCLRQAVKLMKTTQCKWKILGWRSLLSHSRIYGDVEVGKLCFDEIVKMNCKDSACYVLMSNIYIDACMGEDAQKLEEQRKFVGAQKKLGMAFIEIGNLVHQFLVGNKNHSCGGDSLRKLKRLKRPLKQVGFVPSLDLVLELIFDENNDNVYHMGAVQMRLLQEYI